MLILSFHRPFYELIVVSIMIPTCCLFCNILMGFLFFVIFLFLVPLNFCFWECLDRHTGSSSHFTCAHARDKMSSMVLHQYLDSSLYMSRRVRISHYMAVKALHPRMNTFSWLECYVAAHRFSLVLQDLVNIFGYFFMCPIVRNCSTNWSVRT